ncbi:hypothetical protein [Roseomonas sp. 18066]|uniref:hypothetical protein n=1 Tax=Roseomonas sp. 18066 TaxID=2681412 RepID=UPI00135B933C|nr:hypothetical protein [Roseomonas sp. 18066]
MADYVPTSPEPLPANLSEASPEELADALAYALRYDERGKPRPSGGQLVASLAAERLVQHLARSGYVVMKRPPSRLHSAG